ncbi:hypothetical protein [Chryseobacterium viscerum]|uniref:hypothetical protein n=1 Tax=Chryseobacterium viscerum TaxID=1037377 RepID=UPI0013866B38|nr:hypothetical protein [Chryseobacterium viscerum]
MKIIQILSNRERKQHDYHVVMKEGKAYGFVNLYPHDEEADEDFMEKCCKRLVFVYGSRAQSFTVNHKRI